VTHCKYPTSQHLIQYHLKHIIPYEALLNLYLAMTSNGHAAALNGGGANDRIPDVTLPSLHPTYTHENYSLSTLAIHADDPLNLVDDVAPPLHVSTIFRYARNPDELVTASDYDVRILLLWQ
jgi:hypothetical protein